MFECLKFYLKENIDLEQVTQDLLSYGYEFSPSLTRPGEFSKRGGIVDIFPVDFDAPVRIELTHNQIESIRNFNILTGQSFTSHTILIILPFKPSLKLSPRYREHLHEVPIDNFVDLENGDYVVHLNHGIGIYRGINKLKSDGVSKDFLVIEYGRGDKLYVPPHQMHLVQKYIAFAGQKPKLYHLGTKQWQRVKKQTKENVRNLALDMLELQASREALKGFSFSPDTDWQKILEDYFPYRETPDQLKASGDVKRDMEADKPMDRLLCGDVGYGKTEVALRAAFKAVMDNKQVVILVPTTILAEQHFHTFKERLKDFPINLAMLSRFKSQSEQENILNNLSKGAVDIIIGTHRLLSSDVHFKDLGLVIIDEEQRFGVKHKEALKKYRKLVDVLTLTATPIPRTLYMSLMGVWDMSVINTPPEDRLPVKTFVLEYDPHLVKAAIEKELKRRGQVFFVHNRVEDIEKVNHNVKSLVPEARVSFAHGQMPAKYLEEVMLKFIDGEIDVLVSTTIIESGIDIPNANTLIVDRADMFGLADLYQLRGRVGRFKNRAYAYFFIPRGMVLEREVNRRLAAIEKFQDLGSGFKIAMEDLEIRGAGNLLGTQQHGFINAVGFDLYCRLLKETIGEFKKQINPALSLWEPILARRKGGVNEN